ncbi:MAG: hypothetical protein FH749_02460 [Firmicutes bacterium]|nr:hypothetical protein [Bacillota bacterium]
MSVADLKQRLSSINEFIYIDGNDYLREKTSNPLIIKEVIAEAENLLKNTAGEDDKYFLYGTLGNLYRICGEPQAAINYFNDCLNYVLDSGNIKREIVTSIRLGEALKYASRRNEALALFDQAIQKCKDKKIDTYLDFSFQHKGKCLMELGRLDEAKEYLNKALTLREIKGDTSLIDSTKQALDLVRRLQTQ